jgi:uncharacterized transporter YbjL
LRLPSRRSSASRSGNNPAVAYATVYPLCMFLRVIIAQVLLLFLLG